MSTSSSSSSRSEEITANNKRVAAITGASGFTGGALVDRLARDGWHVKVLVREGSEYTPPANVEVIVGPLNSPQVLARLVKDAEFVVHIAAMFREEGSREAFFEINYAATRELLTAAKAAGVKRFVYCSTIGVHGHVEQTPANENAPFNPRDFYQDSKLAAERACADQIGQGPMEIVIVRPASIYGPGDLRMLKMFRMLDKGFFIFVKKGKPNFHPVYIDDLVDGFVLSMTVPEAAGQTFIIGGPEYVPLRDYVALAARTIGARPPRWSVPYALMYGASVVCEALCRVIKVQPPLHRRRLSFFKHNRAFSIAHAQKVLGYRPLVDTAEGFAHTVAWYRSQGLLAKRVQASTRHPAIAKVVAASVATEEFLSPGMILLI